MTKEMLISSSPHETKIALLEDDQLVEVYYERDTDVGLVGGIYKGRVSRVLPGMQSAFVDIGLERDAFLYVSDFFEDSDEYDRVFTEAENRVTQLDQEGGQPSDRIAEPAPAKAEAEPEAAAIVGSRVADSESAAVPPAPQVATPAAGAIEIAPAVPSPQVPPPEATSSPTPANSTGPHHHEFHGHGRRRRGRRFPGHRFGGSKPEFRDRPKEQSSEESHHGLELLPGESLAKYGHGEAVHAPETETTPGIATGGIPADLEGAGTSMNATHPAGILTAGPAGFAAEGTETSEPGEQSRDVKFSSPPDSEQLSPTEGGAKSEIELTDSPMNLLIATPEPGVDETPEEVEAAVQEQSRIDRAIPESEETPASKNPPTLDGTEGFTAGPRIESKPEGYVGPEAGGMIAPESSLSTEEAEMETADAGSASGRVEDFIEEGEAEGESVIEASEGSAQGEGGAAGEGNIEPSPSPSAEGTERSYTLREPHQRPRFAPRRQRRGRGRVGFHGPHEGGRKDDAPRAGNFQPVQINEVLKEGQEILVQIAKEPLGAKGARITSHIALPGRYLVYMPTINHLGVSRKISSEEERLRLRTTIMENRGNLTGGIIVRTAAAGRSEEELKADLRFLGSLWSDIRGKTERSKAPAMIHRDLNVVQRTLRDLLSPDFKTIRIDNEIEYEQVVDFANRCQPTLVGHVRLYTRDVPLFEEFGVQHEIDKALKPKVWLKSGGYIVINQTEALVSIDVNTGKYVGKTNRLEDTIVKVNIDAVKEIVRQIRIRDLGGIIVIDFIDMDDRRNRNKVVQALEEALRADRAPTKILSFNEFGLVALTRKRVKQSLERTLCEPCPYCTGAGWVKSVLTVSYEILAEARKMASQVEGKVMTLRVHPDVARALKSRGGGLLSEIENATHKEIVIKSDLNVQQERFEIF